MGIRWDGAERRKMERRSGYAAPVAIAARSIHRWKHPSWSISRCSCISDAQWAAESISESEARALDGNR